MSQQNVEVVRRLIEAWNRNDLERVVPLKSVVPFLDPGVIFDPTRRIMTRCGESSEWSRMSSSTPVIESWRSVVGSAKEAAAGCAALPAPVQLRSAAVYDLASAFASEQKRLRRRVPDDADLDEKLEKTPVLAFRGDLSILDLVNEHCREVDRSPRRRHGVDIASQERLAEVTENGRSGVGPRDAQLGDDPIAVGR